MVGNPDPPPDHHTILDGNASRYPSQAATQAAYSEPHTVQHLHEVVDLRAIADLGRFKRCARDRRARPALNVDPDHDPAERMDPRGNRRGGYRQEAEAVGPDHRVVV